MTVLFRPDSFVTRAEFTAMVVNIFKKDVDIKEPGFSDVNKDDWFYDAVSYAFSEGLIIGYEDGTFKPIENMYRQDSAVLVANLFNIEFFEKGVDIIFEDEDTFSGYAYQSIKNLASHGIVKGYPDRTFRPFNLITRAEAVKMLDVVTNFIEVPEPDDLPLVPPETPSPTATPEPTATPTPVSSSNQLQLLLKEEVQEEVSQRQNHHQPILRLQHQHLQKHQ